MNMTKYPNNTTALFLIIGENPSLIQDQFSYFVKFKQIDVLNSKVFFSGN